MAGTEITLVYNMAGFPIPAITPWLALVCQIPIVKLAVMPLHLAWYLWMRIKAIPWVGSLGCSLLRLPVQYSLIRHGYRILRILGSFLASISIPSWLQGLISMGRTVDRAWVQIDKVVNTFIYNRVGIQDATSKVEKLGNWILASNVGLSLLNSLAAQFAPGVGQALFNSLATHDKSMNISADMVEQLSNAKQILAQHLNQNASEVALRLSTQPRVLIRPGISIPQGPAIAPQLALVLRTYGNTQLINAALVADLTKRGQTLASFQGRSINALIASTMVDAGLSKLQSFGKQTAEYTLPEFARRLLNTRA